MYLFQFFILINKYEVVTILFLLEHYGVWSVELMIGGCMECRIDDRGGVECRIDDQGGVWSVELMIGGCMECRIDDRGRGVWSVELMIGGVYGV